MNSDQFIVKSQFDDLEIKTIDGKIIHVNKGWLYLISPYFSKLLTSDYVERDASRIQLEKTHGSLLLFFRLIAYCNSNVNHSIMHLDNLSNIEDFSDLVNICEEYQCFRLKNVIDVYLSDDVKLRPLFGNGVEVIKMAYTYDLTRVTNLICKLLANESKVMNAVKFSELPCDFFSIFVKNNSPWKLLIEVLQLWSKGRDPTDEEFKRGKLFDLKWSGMPHAWNSDVVSIIRKFKQAKDFKLFIYESLNIN